PGSTIKPFTIAAALEERVIGADVQIDTSPGHLNINGTKVRDPKNYGSMTLDRILAKSSNVGASKVALLMKASGQWKFLSRIGFGRRTNAGFPNESEGKLSYYDRWVKVDRASLGYGYGISTSLLQLAHAYTVFATGGILYPATIYKRNEVIKGQRIMKEDNAKAVLRMLSAVVKKNATGKNAKIDGYHIAGKTGTAYKFMNKRYRKDKKIVSFVGIAPASNPRIVVAVMINEPKVKRASGGRLAAPVFAKVMASTLRILDIPPDDLPSEQQARKRLRGGAS
ncbi:MAG: penicillin-binding protein 2, partial [Cocleimonas sp.]|nr:penicillin-binding protein 2 [Cocleimonas sp.]